MTVEEPRLRADARRNRDRLLEVARAAFAGGAEPSLEAIARDAGVGIGTLYRHFPTREALVETVYRAELAALCAGVDVLLAEHPPVAALRTWMDHYADFVTTKRGMAGTLREMIAAGTLASARTRETIDDAVDRVLRAGASVGSLRDDVDADDVVTTLVGLVLATEGVDDRVRLGRLFDLVVDGLRP